MSEIRLRDWLPQDAPFVLEAFAAQDMSAQAAGPITTTQDALRWIDQWSGLENGHAFAIVAGDRVCGNVAVTGIDRHDNGWVSYWTAPRVRGKGVASAGLRLLTEWAFAERGLFRLELGHRVNNPASCRVATSAGFLVEGLERAKLRYDGVRYDVELHARLATD
ncbi:Protein N-acetyltransferase, RimJ/RimL family [Nonomuraea maritima]|uniref:Protein N-acetyltransferase, RimJ/RimL family n=1 Tax=Nonomuraea maritima TaxID=683260 RepID=A0A1G9QDV2_9ACTN|nr:GNAT family protein [Nonomuraea maritima]SDM08667.1 Protein N-acetyltransferase, RimJ/RimL family [Nonomuraea maritima]